MNDLGKSVRNVMVIFLVCFVGLISYIAYFQIVKGPDIAARPENVRLWAKRNEVLRGTIYDRDGNALTKSERVNELTQKRTYLYDNLFVHAVGYMDQSYGLSGLEDSYDSVLSYSNNVGNSFRDLLKNISSKNSLKENIKQFVKGIVKPPEEKIGNSIVTTLDMELQKIADESLGDNRGSVVALDPKTGEVLALVSKPTYNPNDLDAEMKKANEGTGEESPLINRAIDGLYPPGSVFKTVTSASALENIQGITTRKFDDKGKITFDDGTELNNFAHEVHGKINLREAYKVSSNVVFGTIAMELGNDKLKATAENFGFNQVIKGEGFTATASQFPTLGASEKGNIAQSGIGQGSVLVTPMQMAVVAATVANDGVMMQPKLVNKVIDKSGNTVKEIESKKVKEVITPDIAETIKGNMSYLVQNNYYRWPLFRGCDAGGKTGTADYTVNGELAVPHGWFIAVAPMSDPQIAVAVIVENGESGSHLAAQICSKLVRHKVLGE